MASRRARRRKGADPVAAITRQVEEAIEVMGDHDDTAGLLAEQADRARKDEKTIRLLGARPATVSGCAAILDHTQILFGQNIGNNRVLHPKDPRASAC